MHRTRTAAITLIVAAATLAGCAGTDPDPSPAGTIWVANENEGSMSILAADTGELIATLTGLEAPHNVAAGDAGANTVWVTTAAGVVAVATDTLTARAAVPAGIHPAHVVPTSVDTVLVTSAGDGLLREITERDLAPRGIVKVADGPHGMRVSADGTLAAIANTTAGVVTLLPLSGPDTVVSSFDNHATPIEVTVGPAPVQVAVADDASTVYVSVSGTREIVRIDVATSAVTGRIKVPAPPAQIWLTADGATLLSADQGTETRPGHTLSVIDTGTWTVRDTIHVGAGPHGVTATEDAATAWVTNVYDDTVSVVDLTEGTVTATLEVGDAPNGVTFVPVDVTAPAGHVADLDVHMPVHDHGGSHEAGHAETGQDAAAGHDH